ncbi:MAG: hypothetical protein KJ065_15670 [Anaerolineae bacterium]|nr:hypothetical protein [Anaerolineae bacterium]
METSLVVIYTHRLRGDLALLPRLYTFLRRLRGDYAAYGRVLLLDLGASCAPDVFPCALTGGRSILIALDAMGYDAANVAGQLSAEDRARLDASHLQMALVDAAHPYHKDGVVVTVGLKQTVSANEVRIDIDPTSESHVEGGILRLGSVEQGQVGLVRLRLDHGRVRLEETHTLEMPADVTPDPTIAGAVEFILGEARNLQRKQGMNAT